MTKAPTRRERQFHQVGDPSITFNEAEAMWMLDCLWNMKPRWCEQRSEADQLRKAGLVEVSA